MTEFLGGQQGWWEELSAPDPAVVAMHDRWAQLETSVRTMVFSFSDEERQALTVKLLNRDHEERRTALEEAPDDYPDGAVPETCWHRIANNPQALENYHQNSCRTEYIQATLIAEGLLSAA